MFGLLQHGEKWVREKNGVSVEFELLFPNTKYPATK
jgi:hypothetical protein